MALKLSDIIDMAELQMLMERFHAATSIPVGIIDTSGEILVATGWQEICTAFHRVHPVTAGRCRQSDAFINEQLPCNGFVEYKCLNGLRDLAVPIIIAGEHVATLYLGQFVYNDEPLDEAHFRRQATEFGFDTERYLAALRRIPAYSRGQVRDIMAFYTSFVNSLAATGLANLRRGEAEKALRESEAKFAAAFQCAPVSMAISTPGEGCFIDVNEEFERMHGYSRGEVIGRTTAELNLWCDSSERQGIIADLQGGGTIRDREITTRHRDGSVLYGLFSASIIDIAGERQMISLHSNITARKQAEKALRESEAKFATAFRTSPDSININRLEDGVFVEVNDTFTTLLGYTADDVAGRSSIEMGIWFDPEVRWQLADRLRQHGVVDNLETRLRRKDGTVIDAVISSRIIFLNQQPCTLSIARDITEQKLRTAELAAAREAAVAANSAKSTFLANMSHEIRTPITGIIGMTELLQLTGLTGQQQLYLDNLRSSAETLLSLINDILDLSQIEADRIELQRKPFSLHATIKELVNQQLATARIKGLILKADIPPAIPDMITGDQLRLKQILLNLVGNALKFTGKGEVVVRVSLEERRADTVRLRFSVIDSGIGIEPGLLTKIFEPFTQADASTTRSFGGSGLGLAISARLTELMGGRITVESTPGAGSVFHVMIPFAVNDLLATRMQAVRRDASPVWEGPPLRILLAEDNDINRELFTILLTRAGFMVVAAGNGNEAVARWEQGRYDVILMDVQMPVMDGIEAMRTIRELEGNSGTHVSIIALTAHAFTGDREKFLAQGFDGYIAKPVTLKALYHEIAKLCRHSGG